MGKRDKTSPRVEVRESTREPRPDFRDFPGPRGATALLRVAMDRSAFADLTAHAKESLDAEVCGVLVGLGCEDEEGAWVEVQAIIRGAAARQGSTHVTFTQETWNMVHETLEREYRGRRIVGWYHTHPGFGVEFSDMDLFIQKNFFPGAEQIAFVTDPLGGAVAICANTAGGIEYLDRFWVEGREQPCRCPVVAANAPTAGVEDRTSTAPADGATLRALEQRIAQLIQANDDTRSLFYRMVAIVGVVCCLGVITAVGYMVYQSYRSRVEPPRLNTFVPVPVQLGDKTVMLGLNLVEWSVPPELEAAFLKAARAQAQQELDIFRQRVEGELRLLQQNASPPSAPASPAPRSEAPSQP